MSRTVPHVPYCTPRACYAMSGPEIAYGVQAGEDTSLVFASSIAHTIAHTVAHTITQTVAHNLAHTHRAYAPSCSRPRAAVLSARAHRPAGATQAGDMLQQVEWLTDRYGNDLISNGRAPFAHAKLMHIYRLLAGDIDSLLEGMRADMVESGPAKVPGERTVCERGPAKVPGECLL
eukprot:3940702-Rhodomonas_salina.3